MPKRKSAPRRHPALLPPLPRLLLAQALGVSPYLGRHEVHRLAPPRQTDAAREARQPPDREASDGDTWQAEAPEAGSGILSAGEVVNLLRHCRYNRSPRIPIARLAAAAGLSRETCYQAMNTGHATEETCVALTPVLREIAAGSLEYQRTNQQWQPVELMPSAEEVEHLQRAGVLGYQDRMVRAADWQPGWACRNCKCRKYTAVNLHGQVWRFCNGCLPWQTAGMGAKPVG